MSSIRISQLNNFSDVKSDDFVPLVDSSSLTTYRATVTSFGGWFADSGSVLSASYASASKVSISSSWATSSISSSTSENLIWPNIATSSYGVNSLSSSWAARSGNSITSSFNTGTSSFSNLSKSSSFSGTASVAITASYVNFALGVPLTSSYAYSSSFSDNSRSGSYAQTSSWAGQSSTSLTASYIATSGAGNGIITKRFNNIGCSWWIANPGGAFSVDNDLYVYNYNAWSGRMNLVKINMQTNVATYMQQWPQDAWYWYGRPFRRPDDNSIHVLTYTNFDLYDYNVTTDTVTRITGTGGYYYDLPVLVLNWSDTSHPNFVALYGSYNASTYGDTPDFRWRRHYYSAGSWHHDFASATVNLRDCVNNSEYREFSNYSSNPAMTENTLCWDFNPIKQKYYLMTTGTGYMHIFEHTTGNITSSWLATSITYSQSLALPLPNTEIWADVATEKVIVDYDIDTGDEKGVIIIRRGNTVLSGCVTYVNWPGYGNW